MRPRRSTKLLACGVVIVAQLALGALVSGHPHLAFITLAGVVAAVAVVAAPMAAMLLAFPATFGYWRVGPASLNLSLADATLALGFVAALPHVPWHAPAFRSMLRIAAVYSLILSIPVVAHPSSRAVVEVGHRLFLIVGAVTIGTALCVVGRVASGLRAFVGAATVVACVAVLDALAHRSSGSLLPEPAYPWGIHKNAAGFLFACALIVLVTARDELSLSRPVRTAASITLFLGLAACQSRGSGITLIVVLLLWAVVHQRGRLSFTTLLGVVLVGAVMVVSGNALFTADSKDSQFNSLNSRVETYNATLDLWHDSKLTGIGLKYWRDPSLTGELAFGEPHNLVVSALGESGIIGLAALAYLVGSTARLLRRQRTVFAVVALLLLAAKTIDSMLGIFWVAGTLTLPLLMVGVAIGASATAPAHPPEPRSPRRTAIEPAPAP